MSIAGVSAPLPVQFGVQVNQAVRPQQQAAQFMQQVGGSRPDGDGDHGVEPQGGKTGQLVNGLA